MSIEKRLIDWIVYVIDTFSSTVVSVCRYHLRDVIVGKIYFLLVRIKIKHMEIAIIKREQTGSGEFRCSNYCLEHLEL